MSPKTENCHGCGEALPREKDFCRHCGRPREVFCPHCELEILDIGKHCHHCGSETNLNLKPTQAPPGGKSAAFCPHCHQTTPLRGRNRFCAVYGREIHLYVEVNEVSLYMHGVRTQTEFRIRPVSDKEIRLWDFKAQLEGIELAPGLVGYEPGQTLPSAGGVLQLDRLVHPVKPDSENGIKGCPAGTGVLNVSLKYEVDEKVHLLQGGHYITVLPSDAPTQTINNYFDERVNQSGDGVFSGGAHNKTIVVEGLREGDKVDNHVKKLKNQHVVNFRPVRMKLQGIVDPPPRPLAPPPPEPPDWAPMDRASLFFMHDALPHFHCLLSKTKLNFGRAPEWADARLYEVETCAPRMQRQDENNEEIDAKSLVSKKQWRIEVTEEGIRAEQLSKRASVTETGKRLRRGDSRALGLGDSIEVPETLGLLVSARSEAFDGLDDARAFARQVLDLMQDPPSPKPAWDGAHGGHTLDRLRSLTGESTGGEYDAFEAYVLMPGWASLGAAEDANIVLPDPGIAPICAHLLYVDGYYFILPHGGETVIRVEGEEVPHDRPWPLKPGNTIHFGEFRVRFDQFKQHYYG